MNLNSNNPNQLLYKTIKWGVVVLVVFFGAFGLWAVFSPLESAAIAPGKVVVAGNRKTIQHLEGGIVQAIEVRNGSVVKAGQVLIQLKNAQVNSALRITKNQLCEQFAMEARLKAELSEASSITFPKRFMKKDLSTYMQQVVALQKSVFKTNQAVFESTIDVHEQRIEQLKQQMVGISAQIKSSKRQEVLIGKELKDVRILAEKRLVRQSRLLELERQAAALEGKEGDLVAQQARLEQKIGETKIEINVVKRKRNKELLADLHKARQRIADLSEQKEAQSDILQRTIIRSPIDGVVVGLQANTVGGVIRPGEVIMDIVPQHEELIIEARINPLDIDVVHQGLRAKVHLTPLKQRTTPFLMGKVNYVSADSFTDERTGQPYYTAEVVITKYELEKLKSKTRLLYPGMPVEVMIITNVLTPWQYLVSPIKQSFGRAFKEQ